MAHEPRVGIKSRYLVDLKLELDVHLGKVTCQILHRDLCDPAYDLVGLVAQGLGYLGVVEHVRGKDLVPLLGAPFVLHLAGSSSSWFLLCQMPTLLFLWATLIEFIYISLI